jgi:hypothetical protein
MPGDAHPHRNNADSLWDPLCARMEWVTFAILAPALIFESAKLKIPMNVAIRMNFEFRNNTVVAVRQGSDTNTRRYAQRAISRRVTKHMALRFEDT